MLIVDPYRGKKNYNPIAPVNTFLEGLSISTKDPKKLV
jgi:hypothetical protein